MLDKWNLSSNFQKYLERYKTETPVKFGVIGVFLIIAYFYSSSLTAIIGLVLGYFAYNDKVDDSCLEENNHS